MWHGAADHMSGEECPPKNGHPWPNLQSLEECAPKMGSDWPRAHARVCLPRKWGNFSRRSPSQDGLIPEPHSARARRCNVRHSPLRGQAYRERRRIPTQNGRRLRALVRARGLRDGRRQDRASNRLPRWGPPHARVRDPAHAMGACTCFWTMSPVVSMQSTSMWSPERRSIPDVMSLAERTTAISPPGSIGLAVTIGGVSIELVRSVITTRPRIPGTLTAGMSQLLRLGCQGRGVYRVAGCCADLGTADHQITAKPTVLTHRALTLAFGDRLPSFRSMETDLPGLVWPVHHFGFQVGLSQMLNVGVEMSMYTQSPSGLVQYASTVPEPLMSTTPVKSCEYAPVVESVDSSTPCPVVLRLKPLVGYSHVTVDPADLSRSRCSLRGLRLTVSLGTINAAMCPHRGG